MNVDLFRRARALLVLGRVSNLPTVWSNGLAGWWLGGGRAVEQLPWLFSGLTFLYLGGMFLNDAFDVEFDRQHRRERPIPSGVISLRAVWRWGWAWLGAGVLLLWLCSPTTGLLGTALAVGIVIYDAVHKVVTFSPLLMGACRWGVYLVAASTAVRGITGWAIWSGLALGTYIAGLSFLARREKAPDRPPYWPVLLLATPIVLALLINVGAYREPAVWLSIILALWVLRCLRAAFWTGSVNVGRAVSGLLAGIVLVDWLAIVHAPRELGLVFLALFGCALVCQRFVPAS